MIPFDLKIVFIDGKYIIIENVLQYMLFNQENTYQIEIEGEIALVFINADQVRMIGKKELIEDILF